MTGPGLTPTTEDLAIQLHESVFCYIAIDQTHIQVFFKQIDASTPPVVFDLERVPPWAWTPDVDVVWLLLEVDDFHFSIATANK